MPVEPHPIQVTVYDIDNTTLLSGVTFRVRNLTRGTELEATQKTNDDGITELDLQNLEGDTPYAAGDSILMVVWKGNKHDAITYTVAGDNKDQTLYLNEARFFLTPTNLLTVMAGNPTAGVLYVKVVDWYDGELIAHLEVPANNSNQFQFGYQGKQCRFVLIREAQTLLVTTNSK